MANVQFFHSVLFCLIAMTLVSGAITGVLALRTADGWNSSAVMSGGER